MLTRLPRHTRTLNASAVRGIILAAASDRPMPIIAVLTRSMINTDDSLLNRDVRKTEILFGFGYKKPNRIRTVQKCDIHTDSFHANCVQSTVQIKSDKNLAFSVQVDVN